MPGMLHPHCEVQVWHRTVFWTSGDSATIAVFDKHVPKRWSTVAAHCILSTSVRTHFLFSLPDQRRRVHRLCTAIVIAANYGHLRIVQIRKRPALIHGVWAGRMRTMLQHYRTLHMRRHVDIISHDEGCPCASTSIDAIYDFVRDFVYDFVHNFVYDFVYDFVRDFVYDFVYDFVRDFVYDFVRDFVHNSVYDFVHNSVYDFVHDSVYDFVHDFVHKSVQEFVIRAQPGHV
jgi:hypothetical protein